MRAHMCFCLCSFFFFFLLVRIFIYSLVYLAIGLVLVLLRSPTSKHGSTGSTGPQDGPVSFNRVKQTGTHTVTVTCNPLRRRCCNRFDPYLHTINSVNFRLSFRF